MLRKVSSARRQIANLRAVLASPGPEEIEACLPALAEAAACLASVEQDLKSSAPPAEMAWELKQLQAELKMAAKLIANGAAFYQGWAKLLASAASGYTPSGDAAPLAAAGSVSVQG
ncbi:MAG TPA: hypothetical protein VK419_15710 [Bryobacteraceae bacterium]|nr:hypothetical protein [Bryobacteraceae bacterium]